MGSFCFWEQVCQEDLLAGAQLDPGGHAMTELVKRFEPLTKKIGRSLTSNRTTQDDLMNEARLALFLAVQRHKPGQAGFAGYAELTMRGAALRWAKGWAKGSGNDLETVEEPVAPEPITTHWGEGEVAAVIQALPERQRGLLAVRYIEDADLATIAQMTGTTESAVSQRLRTAQRAVAALLAA